MSFFWNGYILQDFLFKDFNTKTVPGFIGVCVALLSVGIIYEGLYFWKRILFKKFLNARKEILRRRTSGFEPLTSENDEVNETGDANPRNNLLQGGTSEEDPDLPPPVSQSNRRESRTSNYTVLYLLSSSILHSMYAFIGYTLMNAVMTFNTWVFAATCAGIGLGYFIFRPDTQQQSTYPLEVLNSECSAKTDVTDCCETDKTNNTVHSPADDDDPGPSSGERIFQRVTPPPPPNDKQVPVAKVIVVGAQVHRNQQESI